MRYGERTVTLTHADGVTLAGTQFLRYPVDEPPVVEVPSTGERLYLEVWEQRGWTVSDKVDQPVAEPAPVAEADDSLPRRVSRAVLAAALLVIGTVLLAGSLR